MRLCTTFALTAASLGTFTAATALAQPNVLIAAAANPSTADCRFTDVQNKLMATGQFGLIDIFNASAATPTLAELQMYDVVLTWSNVGYANGALMGDVLADYVDAGGAVVVGVFANATTPTSTLRLTGRWSIGDYEVILGGSGQSQGAAQLGVVHDPGHPIMAGVMTFDGGSSSYRPIATVLAPGATSIADWTDGKVLVAVGANPKRVDLGFYPPSSVCRADFWLASTDGGLLMANALAFASGGGTPVCYANCDASTTEPILNVDDFTCFINEFAAAQSLPHQQQISHYANCDESTTAPVLNVDDFTCFINAFAQGCL